ncbi:para-aminobenzoate synthetase [Entomortierella parvispora]|uniref:aminodeoxychorismate synthase n=1 Tax=Entomortierella parvispora TaxID=205924 RepID=A0A9P3H4K4_9FUNG|nr:para-aminobenzoate synthetase [Entomortierella parvispora]
MPSSVDRGTNDWPTQSVEAAVGAAHMVTSTLDPAPTLRTLIVDNYDSYTFNLLQLFDKDQLENVVVIRNDQVEWSRFEQEVLPYFDQVVLSPGPGRPERKEDFGLCTQILQTSHIPVFGVCLGHQGIGWIHGGKVTYGPEPVHGQIARIKHDGTGLFQGVPDGFEAVRYHSLVIQEQDLPSDLIATAWCRSFPLITVNNTDRENNVSASGSNRAQGSTSIMGIRHRTLPHHGVQFHPESICSKHGKQMMNNFFNISEEFYANKQRSTETLEIPDRVRALSVIPTRPVLQLNPTPSKSPASSTSPFSLHIHALDPAFFPDPEVVFESLFLTGPRSQSASWWLDSARQPHPMSRFSFMGGVETRSVHRRTIKPITPKTGASQAVIQYSTLHKEVSVRQYSGRRAHSDVKRIKLQDPSDRHSGVSSFWDWMSKVMGAFGNNNVETKVTGVEGDQDFETVPFDFFAGMIGYFSYEMKRESLEGYRTPVEQQCHCTGHSWTSTLPCNCDCSIHPDASFILATQAVVYDHVDKRVYVLGLVNNHQDCSQETDIGASVGFSSLSDCEHWIKDVSDSIAHISTNGFSSTTKRKSVLLAAATSQLSHNEPYNVRQRHRRQSSSGFTSPFKVDSTEENYIRAIQDSLDYIHEGESYELCLTTQFRAKLPLYPKRYGTAGSVLENEDLSQVDYAFDLYKILRKLNPAPFSAFLSLPLSRQQKRKAGDDIIDKLIILSSSPERFLKIGKTPVDESQSGTETGCRTVEMKPIKGTVAVAKGCFCKQDEGCSVDEHDSDSSEHNYEEDDDEDMAGSEPRFGQKADRNSMTARDRCAEARQREDQSRIDSLSKNIKERAENLMIVDLIRNDLAHVCSSQSVRVPYLMHVESYETVHQLVTTVRGELLDHVDTIQAVKACFPPGSMTGAPKLRSVQLLDSLEHNVKRGVYSGCLGYIGIPAVAAGSRSSNTCAPVKIRSAVDMAVVIRTAVLSITPASINEGSDILVADVTVGAGGALTILSDPNEEWREVLLKSRSVVPSVMSYMRQHAL